MSLRRVFGYLVLGAMLATPIVYSSPQGGLQKKGKRKGGKGSPKGGKRGGSKGQTRKKGGGA